MAENSQIQQDLEKAKVFFERAEEVASTGNFDYAIEMYLDGLRLAPDAVEHGHIPLRQMALLRQAKGGKKPSMLDKLKRGRGKDHLEEMLNNEWLFARDPDNLAHGEAILKAASAGGFKKTASWVADMVFDAAVSSPKPSAQTFLMLKDAFAGSGEWEKAIRALHHAIRLKPNDLALADELRNLSAELAVKKGKYDQNGDFRQSMKDQQQQDKLQAQDAVVKSETYKTIALDAARAAYEQNPNAADAILKLADTLGDIGTEESFTEAYDLLEKIYIEKREFSFKRRAGELKIKHLGQKLRAAKTAHDTQQTAATKAVFDHICGELAAVELEHYRLCVEHYPTDPRMKYEYGTRLMRNRQFDEAIPMLQDAQKDLRHRIASANAIGQCFFLKGWYPDAIDIFQQAIESYEIKDDAIAKDLRYNLARSFEEQGKAEEALEIYRKLAQLDFGFKDVIQRVNKLRKPG
ncbi:MAG: tetratricopeptide repeat protein [Sedimentisphaerales bacterium]|nr:tetratricopeptide repeat protein [Sedimentisphaerales bacterium]